MINILSDLIKFLVLVKVFKFRCQSILVTIKNYQRGYSTCLVCQFTFS